MRALAAQLGLCQATVSLALRNHPSISVPTRERVQELARQQGYRANVLVSALLTQVRSGRLNAYGEVIAFLDAGPKPDSWTVPPSFVEGFKQAGARAAQLGLRVDPFWLGPKGAHSAQIARILASRGIRGFIIPPVPLDLRPLHLDWGRHASVAVGFSFQQKAVHRVGNGHFNGMFACYKKLHEKGYRRIGLMLRTQDDERALHSWQGAFLIASRHFGAGVLEPLALQEPCDPALFFRWFDAHQPDAVIGVYPDPALGWLRGRGIKIPKEVGYASLDVDVSTLGHVAGIRQNHGAIFATAVEILAGELSRNEFGLPAIPKVTLIDGMWTDGPTIRARRS
ncbi:MAG: LacI family DNA-binding transcriptional regulator [Rariglobus sp.]